MSSVEGSLITAFTIGVLCFVATKIGFTIASKLDEKKGYLGTVVIFYITGALLWLNAGSVASYFGSGRSEVELVAIMFIVFPTLYALIRNREHIKTTARTGYNISQKTTSGTKKAVKKVKR